MRDKVIIIDCRDCQFNRRINPEDDESPPDIVLRHGRRYGHTMNIDAIEENELLSQGDPDISAIEFES